VISYWRASSVALLQNDLQGRHQQFYILKVKKQKKKENNASWSDDAYSVPQFYVENGENRNSSTEYANIQLINW
jgi:hypothetical protein